MKIIVLKIILLMLLLLPGGLGAAKNVGTIPVEPGNKPIVIMLHGWARNRTAMWYLDKKLEKFGFHVIRLEYSSLAQHPEDIIKDITQQINECFAKYHQNKVHFVGHSMGGLIIRAYLEENHVPNLGRVVLMGTPSQGVPIVDTYHDKWWMKALGPSARALGAKNNSFPKSIGSPTYPVGVIAGQTNNTLNDGIIPGNDDGLVPVKSTKFSGMTDFITINSGHCMMRYDKEAARQVSFFLKNGRFDRN